MKHCKSSRSTVYMVRQKKRHKFYKLRLRAWVMGGNPNGDTKIASSVLF